MPFDEVRAARAESRGGSRLTAREVLRCDRRAPAANSNGFARESHIDIMAASAKIDPVEFRMANATGARLLHFPMTPARVKQALARR